MSMAAMVRDYEKIDDFTDYLTRQMEKRGVEGS